MGVNASWIRNHYSPPHDTREFPAMEASLDRRENTACRLPGSCISGGDGSQGAALLTPLVVVFVFSVVVSEGHGVCDEW